MGSKKTSTMNNQKTPGGVRSKAEKRLQNGPRKPHGSWALTASGPSQTSILKVVRTKKKGTKAQMHPSGTAQPTMKTIRAKSGPQKKVTRPIVNALELIHLQNSLKKPKDSGSSMIYPT